MTRPPKGMRVTAMATMTAGRPVPIAIEIAMARMRSGNACITSMSRWLTRSKRPPRYPHATPHSEPVVVPSSTDANATKSDVRAPWMTRESVSRPTWSVPK